MQKITFLLTLLILSGTRVWAMDHAFTENEIQVYVTTTAPTLYEVTKASETWALEYFISSGRLCDFRGRHEWGNDVGNLSESPCGTWTDYGTTTIYDPGQMCVICHRCRQKTKVTKDGEIWEK